MNSQNDSDDIKCWLKDVLSKENLTDFAVNILGNSEKGDGYMGDIVFVHVDGKTADDKPKSFDLVLKCGKKSQALREKIPVREVFENEIYSYSRIFPTFKQFQAEKGVEDVFDSVPPCFGQVVNENMEVLVLQNLKTLGYRLHDRKKALDSEHLELLMREYGKLHAISGAMQQQRPDDFKQLVDGIGDVLRKFRDALDITKMVVESIDEVYNVVKEDISKNVGQKLLDFKNQIDHIFEKLIYDQTRFCVITHGDCWNNNFMFKYTETDQSKPVKVAMLDWQCSIFGSPILDLSYFLYASISRNDLKNFEGLLKVYHTSFSNFVRELGGDPEKLFSYKEFLKEWKKFAKFGFMMAMFMIKFALSDNDEVKDVSETLESGGDFTSNFVYDIKDTNTLKERLLVVIEHAVHSDIL